MTPNRKENFVGVKKRGFYTPFSIHFLSANSLAFFNSVQNSFIFGMYLYFFKKSRFVFGTALRFIE